MELKPYAARFSAIKIVRSDGSTTNHIMNSLTMTMAYDREHAVGKAYAVAMKVYPTSKGWTDHSAAAIPADAFTDIDDWEECVLPDQG